MEHVIIRADRVVVKCDDGDMKISIAKDDGGFYTLVKDNKRVYADPKRYKTLEKVEEFAMIFFNSVLKNT